MNAFRSIYLAIFISSVPPLVMAYFRIATNTVHQVLAVMLIVVLIGMKKFISRNDRQASDIFYLLLILP